MRFGQSPSLSVLSRNLSPQSSQQTEKTILIDDLSTGQWLAPLSTRNAEPGVLLILLSSASSPIRSSVLSVSIGRLPLGSASGPLPISGFTFFSAPTSPFAVILPDSSTNRLVYSANSFASYHWLEIDPPASLCSGLPIGLMGAGVLPSSLLLLQSGSLIEFTADQQRVHLVGECVSGLAVVGQPLSTDASNVVLAWTGSGDGVWLRTRSQFDSIHQSVGPFMHSVTDGAVSRQLALLLVESSPASPTESKLHVVTYSIASQSSRAFALPRSVHRSTPTQLDQNSTPVILLNGMATAAGPASGSTVETVELSLAGIALSNHLGSDVYLWGNVLLYSPDGCLSFYLLLGDTSTDIVAFSSDSAGYYSVLNSDGSMQIGQMSSHLLYKVYPPSSVQSGFVRTIFFDSSNLLHTIDIANDGSAIVRQNEHAWQHEIDEAVSLAGHSCPYQSSSLSVDVRPLVTRLRDVKWNDLPSEVFVSYGVSFAFNVTLKPSDNAIASLDNLQASLQMPPSVNLKGTVERVADISARKVVYSVVLKDRKIHSQQYPPGVGNNGIPVRLLFAGASLACLSLGMESSGSLSHSTLVSLVALDGCAPEKRLIFDLEASLTGEYGLSKGMAQGCVNTDGVACVSFENPFIPVTRIEDLITGDSELYTGHYTFSIVGGGLTTDSIVEYTEDEQRDYNSGGALIWTRLDEGGDPHTFSSDSGVTWLCTQASPCGQVLPVLPNQPEFIFVVEISTAVEHRSHCEYSTTFLLRLGGIPMSFLMILLVILASIVLTVLVVLLVFLWVKQRRPWLVTLSGVAVDSKRKME